MKTKSLELSKRYPIKLIWLLPIPILIGIGIYSYNRGNQAISQPTTSEVRILPVTTTEAELVTSYASENSYTGIVEAKRSSDIGFERSGLIIEVLVEAGDSVTQGTPLAKLDNRNLLIQRQELLARREAATAKLEELTKGPRIEKIQAATARVNDLKQQLELEQLRQQRREFLLEEGAISQEQFDQTTYTSNSLASRLEAAESELEELVNGTRSEQIREQKALTEQLTAQIDGIDLEISKSVLKAPFDGIISQGNIDEGTVINPGQTILRLVETTAMEVKIGIPVDLAAKLSIGSIENLLIEEKEYQGKITAILPELDNQTRTATVILDILNPNNLKTGQIARLNLQQEVSTEGYWLPTTALSRGVRGLWAVYGAVETETPGVYRVEAKDVEILVTSGDRVLVNGLIQSGDKLITSGIQRLIPGQLVKINP